MTTVAESGIEPGEQGAVPGGEPVGEIAGRTPFQLAFARLRRDKVALVSLVVIILLIVLAAGAPVIASLTGHGRDQQFHETGLTPDGFPVGPSSTFLLGTDQSGRDVLVRTIYGARVSLVVGVFATLVAALVGTVIGLIAGYTGGRTDTILSRIIDIFLSFPFLLTALTFLTLNHNAMTGGTKHSPLLIVSAIIALFTWTFFARLVRGQVISLREREFIEAARSLGAGPLRIMFTDVLPNLTGPVLVYITLQIPVNVVLESTLSFLGVGVVAPTPTWGNMLADAQSSGFYLTAPWFLLSPTVALLITVLAFNLFGDGLRDALDPRRPHDGQEVVAVIAFVIRRLGYMVLVLLIIAIVAFGLSSIANNDPAALLAPKGANADAIAQIRINLHLNDPLYLQFWHFLTRGPDIRGAKTGLLHWPPSLGYSFQREQPVTTILAQKLPATLSLALGAAVLWLAMAIPAGVLSATKPRSIRDRVFTTLALTGLSFPTFVLGLLFSYVFFYEFHTQGITNFFPASGYVPLTSDPAGWFQHLILPWLTLALTIAAVYVRITRSSMLDVLGEDYIRTARAKGLREGRVVYRHALRSALTPVVTLAGIDLATLLGGAIVTEQVWGFDGVGRLAVSSVIAGDLPVVVGVTLVGSFFFVVANVIVDILYAVLDARVRVS